MANASAIALLIEEILAAISAIGPTGIELYLKLESLFNLGPDEQANVAAAIKAGLAADSETIGAIESWKQQVGL
jgi:sugar phosphate isomerase/epimerase